MTTIDDTPISLEQPLPEEADESLLEALKEHRTVQAALHRAVLLGDVMARRALRVPADPAVALKDVDESIAALERKLKKHGKKP